MAVITTKQPHMAARTPVFPDFSLLLPALVIMSVSQLGLTFLPASFVITRRGRPPLTPPFPASLAGKCWNRRHNDSSLSSCSSDSSLSVATQRALSTKPSTVPDPPRSNQRRHKQLIMNLYFLLARLIRYCCKKGNGSKGKCTLPSDIAPFHGFHI